MPRTLKRGSDAISRTSPSPSPETAAPPRSKAAANPTRRPQRQASPSPSPSPSASSANSVSDPDADEAQTQAHSQDQATHHKTLVKKLVRLALATEYARQPLRRTDVSNKIFKDSGSGRRFKAVFADAQKVLGGTFGMRLVELPGREKWGLKERRKEISQLDVGGTQRGGGRGGGKSQRGGRAGAGRDGGGGGGGESQGAEGTGGKAWILTSILPEDYRRNPEIVQPSRAGGGDLEAGYTGLYTFLISLLYLNGGELSEGKMEKYLERVNVGMVTEWGQWEKVVARMVREGYLDRRREDGEGWVYVVGPRGKVEVGVGGVEGLVKGVYGVGLEDVGEEDEANRNRNGNANGKMDEEELDRRLTRSLGVIVGGGGKETPVGDEGGEHEAEQPQQRRSGKRRGARNDDEDYD